MGRRRRSRPGVHALHSDPAPPSLEAVADRREFRLAGVQLSGRRRRPSGEPAPLRQELGTSGRVLLVGASAVAIAWIAIAIWPAWLAWWDAWEGRILVWLEELRTASATRVARNFQLLASAGVLRVLAWALVIVLVVLRRWRHLAVGVVSLLSLEWLANRLTEEFGRLPPDGLVIAGRGESFTHPSLPVMALTTVLLVAAFSLLPGGAMRRRSLAGAALLIVTLTATQAYLGVGYPSDGVFGMVVAAAVVVTAFRLLAPEGAFPIIYRRGNTAHLDVSGVRGVSIRAAIQAQMLVGGAQEKAMRTALADQLGCQVLTCRVLDMEPFGLEGSAGSTPLRIEVAGDPVTVLFGKLYSTSHLRSDRWYKLGRAIMYGALEDESPFSSVRRLVEHEDYMLRVMTSAGLPVPEPYGFVEVSPRREYLIITEFLDGAVEIGDVDVDDDLIHDALGIVRRMWDAGLAHRDIKPSNLMVRHGRVHLVDVAFAEVRASAWRQAVDLANMMLILALRRDPADVYAHAIQHFAPEDIAEAFAATRGVTIPSQLRAALRERRHTDGVDLLAGFRAMGPECPPVSIQRWSTRRLALAASAAALASALGLFLIESLQRAEFL